MPRRKLSEFRAKTIVNALLGKEYQGWSVVPDNELPTKYGKTTRFVVKVDQAVKQRFKKGLIFLDVPKSDIAQRVDELKQKGYSHILIEPYTVHDDTDERYISFRREREGVVFSYSRSGGVEIESHADQIKSGVYEDFSFEALVKETGLSGDNLQALRIAFDQLHMTLLEINPYIIENGQPAILDVAIEVDSSAELLVDEWMELDVRTPATNLTEQEKTVRKLDKESSASFSLEVINPDGAIFLLLSGGGASVVIADEIFTLGHGNDLANYGEYSGNPTEDETYHYANQVLRLLFASKAKRKVVLIGGAVANFTDIAATFRGVISSLEEHKADIAKQDVKVYVRRGGPRQEIGLKRITQKLDELGILGGVYDPSTSIPEAVQHLTKALKK